MGLVFTTCTRTHNTHNNSPPIHYTHNNSSPTHYNSTPTYYTHIIYYTLEQSMQIFTAKYLTILVDQMVDILHDSQPLTLLSLEFHRREFSSSTTYLTFLYHSRLF